MEATTTLAADVREVLARLCDACKKMPPGINRDMATGYSLSAELLAGMACASLEAGEGLAS